MHYKSHHPGKRCMYVLRLLHTPHSWHQLGASIVLGYHYTAAAIAFTESAILKFSLKCLVAKLRPRHVHNVYWTRQFLKGVVNCEPRANFWIQISLTSMVHGVTLYLSITVFPWDKCIRGYGGIHYHMLKLILSYVGQSIWRCVCPKFPPFHTVFHYPGCGSQW